MPESSEKSYMTNEEAADYLRMSPRTLEKRRVIGGGPHFRKLGHRVVYARTDLDAWTAARDCESTSDANYEAARRPQRRPCAR